ncbi:MAG: hypothetical protein ACRDOY_10900 [Nocardioidaceae bacterium]
MPTAAQALRHRRDRDDLIDIAFADIGALFRQFDTAAALREALMDLLPQLYEIYGAAVATLSADWYDDMREADGVRGGFTAIPVELRPDAGTDELTRWGLGPMFQAVPDKVAARSLVEGGLQRRIADVSRETIMLSSVEDPSATGWQRVGEGGCTSGFCDMLIGRGAVYTEADADFASHDHCRCSAVPAWGGEPKPVRGYTPSQRNVTDADRARVREYLRTN